MKTSQHAISVVALLVGFHATASPLSVDENDEILARNQELSAMEFKRDQMKLQAEMASSIKAMMDAGVLVNEKGEPLGIESLTALATDVRERSKNAPAANPFSMAGQMQGMPFDGPNEPVPAQSIEPREIPKPVDPPKALQLVQINADSVIVRTADGERMLRIGETVNGLKLASFDASRAFLKGENGTEVLRIEWTRSRR
jgi:hypothetical protein